MPLDLTRSLMVILIPGGIAVAPWLLCLVYASPSALGYVEKFTAFAHAVAFSVAVIVGLVCETTGTWIEFRWDVKREAEFGIRENWFRYLANTVSPEPVGYRYVSRRATAFYFELCMFVACVPFAGGIGLFALLVWPNLSATLSLVLILTLLSALWFRQNARKTHALLCETRMELNKRLQKP